MANAFGSRSDGCIKLPAAKKDFNRLLSQIEFAARLVQVIGSCVDVRPGNNSGLCQVLAVTSREVTLYNLAKKEKFTEPLTRVLEVDQADSGWRMLLKSDARPL